MFEHLQHAIDVEFWTIPLYLTALYSIKGLQSLHPKDYPDAAKLIQSVVIQEMLHLELICNISNAVGYAPYFNPPQYDETKSIPFIHPQPEALPEMLRGYICKPGALNIETLKFFCAIELPHHAVEFDPEGDTAYHSIAEMYAALKLGLEHLWKECYAGDKSNTRQKTAFQEYAHPSGRHHGFSVSVNSLKDALTAIEAIVAQGEGADHKLVPVDFRPHGTKDRSKFDPGEFKPERSHYQKFFTLLHLRKLRPEVYPITSTDAQAEQRLLDENYREFLNELIKSFNTDGPEMTPSFWKSMFSLPKAIIGVWEKGACPQFTIK